MAKKVILTLLASILVIAACAGAIIALVHSSKARSDIPSGPGSSPPGNAVSISKLCTAATYKESCERTLSQISTNNSVTPADVFRMFVEVAIKEFESAASCSVDVTKGKTLGSDAGAVPVCQEVLSDGMNYLKELLASLQGNDVQSVLADPDTINIIISGAMTHIETCVDSFDGPDMHNQMRSALKNATEMSSNALAVIVSMASVEEELESDLNNLPAKGGSRRLMGHNLDEEGFPTWLSAGDRKLLQAHRDNVKPDAVVAKDGSGQYKTIMEAIEKMPIQNGRYKIYVKAGNYTEMVRIPEKKNNIFMYGDGAAKTIVSGNRSNGTNIPTYDSASFAADARGFIARDMHFENTAPPEHHQAVAFRAKGDLSVFYRCSFTGHQDTLYVHNGRQFIRDCTISGTVDFIFGNSKAIFQNCNIYAEVPQSGQSITITASGRQESKEATGFVIQNCRIKKNPKLNTVTTKSFLGRPWKKAALTVVMESLIDGFIDPAGWSIWETNPPPSSVYYGEYANFGPGSSTAGRVKWLHRLTRRVASLYTPGRFFGVAPGPWLMGIPYDSGFTKQH